MLATPVDDQKGTMFTDDVCLVAPCSGIDLTCDMVSHDGPVPGAVTNLEGKHSPGIMIGYF